MQGALAAACIGVLVLSLNLFSPGAQAPVVADGPRLTASGADASAQEKRAGAADAPTRAAESALQHVMPEVDFVEVPFEQVVDFVREALGVNTHVRWRTLEDAGVTRDFPVSMKLRNVTVERLLRLIFAEQTETEIDFAIEEGVVIISTRENLQRRRTVEVYDVRDLMVWSQRNDAMAGGKAADDAAEEASDRLTQLITSCVEPESWVENGGEGTLERVASALVVRQSDSVHRQLRTLLADLRRVAASETNVAR